MADEVLDRGQSVCLIDTSDPGSGSSGAPLVLINPATGRRAKMVQNAPDSLSAIIDLLMRVKEYSGRADFFEHNGILRPALDSELANDLNDLLQNTTGPTSPGLSGRTRRSSHQTTATLATIAADSSLSRVIR